MKDKLIIIMLIWYVAVLVGSIICYCIGRMTTGSYYITMTGCGIWLVLMNMYIDRE